MMTKFSIPDIQNQEDKRQRAIDRVGIRAVRHPFVFQDKDESGPCATVGRFNLFVSLPHHKKGTHMSRFVDFLNNDLSTLSIADLDGTVTQMTEKLGAEDGFFSVAFPFFIQKSAPVSHEKSIVDYDVILSASLEKGKLTRTIRVIVPITTLCPCSKEISDYGAHNQRSYITLTAALNAPVNLKSLINALERQGSSEVYSLLKRPDEKYVTEYAYDNPKFVEDLVRDLAALIDNCPAITAYRIESENMESIHNHSAYAMIESPNADELNVV